MTRTSFKLLDARHSPLEVIWVDDVFQTERPASRQFGGAGAFDEIITETQIEWFLGVKSGNTPKHELEKTKQTYIIYRRLDHLYDVCAAASVSFRCVNFEEAEVLFDAGIPDRTAVLLDIKNVLAEREQPIFGVQFAIRKQFQFGDSRWRFWTRGADDIAEWLERSDQSMSG